MRDRWEALEPRKQAMIAFPVFAVLTFLLNLGPFAQPLGSCVIYAVIEGGVFTFLLLYATRYEREHRDK